MLPTIIALALLAGWAPPAPKSLSIVKPTFHQYEDGPGLAPGAAFHTGETVFLTFRVQGYQASADARIHLVCKIEPLDPDGVRFAEPATREVQTTLAAEDKDWLPIVRQSFLVPPLALSGTYRLVITVEDKIGSRQAKTEIEFPVRGREVAPSDTITVRNFRFFKSEEDTNPIVPAVYRPGDAVWVRFDITGYKFGENNRIRVSYGVSVIGPAGNTMYTQPAAAVEEGESYYPKKYLPSLFSLSLNDKVRPGTYVIVLELNDEVGGQTAESRHGFRVE